MMDALPTTAPGQPTHEQAVQVLRRRGVIVEDVARCELREGGLLTIDLLDGHRVWVLPGWWRPGPDCFGHAECVGLNSCPRKRACSE